LPQINGSAVEGVRPGQALVGLKKGRTGNPVKTLTPNLPEKETGYLHEKKKNESGSEIKRQTCGLVGQGQLACGAGGKGAWAGGERQGKKSVGRNLRNVGISPLCEEVHQSVKTNSRTLQKATNSISGRDSTSGGWGHKATSKHLQGVQKSTPNKKKEKMTLRVRRGTTRNYHTELKARLRWGKLLQTGLEGTGAGENWRMNKVGIAGRNKGDREGGGGKKASTSEENRTRAEKTMTRARRASGGTGTAERQTRGPPGGGRKSPTATNGKNRGPKTYRMGEGSKRVKPNNVSKRLVKVGLA